MGLQINKPLPEADMRFIAEHVDVGKLRSMYGVITGATGWFGSWICEALDYMGCKYQKVDTRKLKPLQCDYCIQLAPGDPRELIYYLKKTDVEHVLFVSSGSVYDSEQTSYSIEKQDGENAFIESGLPVNIARCFSFTGAGVCQKPLVMGDFINDCIYGEPLEVYNGGKSIRTYMYMSDLVIWLLAILLSEKGCVYDVGGNEPLTILQLAEKVNAHFGNRNGILLDDKYYDHEPRPNYVPNLKPAYEMGLRVLTDLDTAIEKTIEWEINNAS